MLTTEHRYLVRGKPSTSDGSPITKRAEPSIASTANTKRPKMKGGFILESDESEDEDYDDGGEAYDSILHVPLPPPQQLPCNIKSNAASLPTKQLNKNLLKTHLNQSQNANSHIKQSLQSSPMRSETATPPVSPFRQIQSPPPTNDKRTTADSNIDKFWGSSIPSAKSVQVGSRSDQGLTATTARPATTQLQQAKPVDNRNIAQGSASGIGTARRPQADAPKILHMSSPNATKTENQLQRTPTVGQSAQPTVRQPPNRPHTSTGTGVASLHVPRPNSAKPQYQRHDPGSVAGAPLPYQMAGWITSRPDVTLGTQLLQKRKAAEITSGTSDSAIPLKKQSIASRDSSVQLAAIRSPVITSQKRLQAGSAKATTIAPNKRPSTAPSHPSGEPSASGRGPTTPNGAIPSADPGSTVDRSRSQSILTSRPSLGTMRKDNASATFTVGGPLVDTRNASSRPSDSQQTALSSQQKVQKSPAVQASPYPNGPSAVAAAPSKHTSTRPQPSATISNAPRPASSSTNGTPRANPTRPTFPAVTTQKSAANPAPILPGDTLAPLKPTHRDAVESIPAASDDADALSLSTSPAISDAAEPYFEYSVFQKTWSSPFNENSTVPSEIISRPYTNIDEANAQAEKLFHNFKSRYTQHLHVQFSTYSSALLDDCVALQGTFSPIDYPTAQSHIKIYTQRNIVSIFANQTPQTWASTPLLSKTAYALRLFKLISPFSGDTDGEFSSTNSHSNTQRPLRVYHALPCTEIYTSLDAANRAARRLQVELSHVQCPKDEISAKWQQQNLKDLNTKVRELDSKTREEGEGRCWRSVFNAQGKGGDKFEVVVEKVGICGPRN